MKIGLCLPQLGATKEGFPDRNSVLEFAKNAEAAGFDSLWVQDHIMVPENPQTGFAGGPLEIPMPYAYRTMFSPLELLSFAAAVTENVQLATSILVTAYYRPVELAKRLATLDILSGGRALAGLGLGWSKDEYAHMDTPFERRAGRMTDFLKALKACMLPDPVQYDGEFFQIPECDTSPKPLQKNAAGEPQVPIALGGGSPGMLKRLARHADSWNPAGMPAEAIVAGLAQINQFAEEAGREHTFETHARIFTNPTMEGAPTWDGGFFAGTSWTGTANDMKENVIEFRDAGIDQIILETNYWEPNPGPEFWPRHVDFFEPLVDVAHS